MKFRSIASWAFLGILYAIPLLATKVSAKDPSSDFIPILMCVACLFLTILLRLQTLGGRARLQQLRHDHLSNLAGTISPRFLPFRPY